MVPFFEEIPVLEEVLALLWLRRSLTALLFEAIPAQEARLVRTRPELLFRIAWFLFADRVGTIM